MELLQSKLVLDVYKDHLAELVERSFIIFSREHGSAGHQVIRLLKHHGKLFCSEITNT